MSTPATCAVCGGEVPRAGSLGWLHLSGLGGAEAVVWDFCSWPCLSRFAIDQELRAEASLS